MDQNTILVVDDDRNIRESVVRLIQSTPAFRTGWQVNAITDIHPKMVVESIAHQMMYPRKMRPAVVVLDLNLGHSMTDGLAVIRSLKHSFNGIWIIHSNTFFEDKEVRDEALSLGVRFAVRKFDRSLGEIAHALLGLAIQKQLLADFALSLLTDREMLDYPRPTDLRQLLLKLLRIGHEFNGSEDPIPWSEVMATQVEFMAHAVAQQEYAESRLKQMPEEVRKSSESYLVRDTGVLLNAMANFTTIMWLDVKAAKPYLIQG